MYNLLSIEWLKVRRYRTFWVINGLFAFAVLVTFYAVSAGGLGEISKMMLSEGYTIGEYTYNVIFYASHFVIFLAVLVAILFTNEVQFRTSRQNVIDGWSRVQFFNAKWSVILSLSLATTLFVFLIALLGGALAHVSFEGIGAALMHAGRFFLLTVNYLGFGLLAGVLLRKAGLAIAILLLYYMLEQLLHVMLVYNGNAGIPAGDLFLPLESSDQLMPRPLLGKMLENAMPYKMLPAYAYASATVAWIAVYYFGGRSMLQRRDW